MWYKSTIIHVFIYQIIFSEDAAMAAVHHLFIWIYTFVNGTIHSDSNVYFLQATKSTRGTYWRCIIPIIMSTYLYMIKSTKSTGMSKIKTIMSIRSRQQEVLIQSIESWLPILHVYTCTCIRSRQQNRKYTTCTMTTNTGICMIDRAKSMHNDHDFHE